MTVTVSGGRSTDGDVARARLRGVARVALTVVSALLMAVVLPFLLLPIVALITYQPLRDLIHGFGAKVAIDAVVVSLKTNAIAFALTIALGTPFSYILARTRFRGRSVVITLVEIPLVMRILKRQFRGQAGVRYGLGNLVSQVLTFDYLGALAVSTIARFNVS